ncbi:YbfA family protein [Erwiniaceae bacterium CAU 1747]
MNIYQSYSPWRIFMRRAAVVIAGVLALPVMLFRSDRARFYSYLHRVWVKTSDKPVWLAESESVCCDFY